MFRRRTAILYLVILMPCWLSAQDPARDDLLRYITGTRGQATVIIPLPDKLETRLLAEKVSVASVRGKKAEIVLSPLTAEWFISRKYDYSISENDEELKGLASSGNMAEAMEWNTYPTYQQYDSVLKSFASLYPTLCILDTIGTTNYSKQVLVLKISDNPQADEPEPEVFYTSTMHGDETGGFILMLRLADTLLKSYGTSARIRNLVDNLEIWINPLANPDGTYRTGNLISSPTRFNALGYDLNRNFPDPVSDDPDKQVETLDMIRFMRNRDFVISANFHGGEEVVNYPWDRWERRHPDEDWFWYISRKYADTVHLHSPAGYMTFMENGVTNGWDWYYVYGGRQDFVTYDLHGREVTIELDNTKMTPASELDDLWEYNRRSLLGYLENALYGIHGTVTDAETGEPVPARIFISGHDRDNSHVFADTLKGAYTRLIAPGTWELLFTADGYLNNTAEVVVVKDQPLYLDVQMIPFVNPVDTAEVDGPFVYPNPANGIMKVVLPGRQTGQVEVSIYNPLGTRIIPNSPDSYLETYEDIPLEIDVTGLAEGVYTLVIRNRDTKAVDKTKFVIVHRK
jgi:hypothetical protein